MVGSRRHIAFLERHAFKATDFNRFTVSMLEGIVFALKHVRRKPFIRRDTKMMGVFLVEFYASKS